MMFDGLPDLKTGTSMKNQPIKEFNFGTEAMRVTTTEAQDIFDDDEEIWNGDLGRSITHEQVGHALGHSASEQQDPTFVAPDASAGIEEKSVS